VAYITKLPIEQTHVWKQEQDTPSFWVKASIANMQQPRPFRSNINAELIAIPVSQVEKRDLDSKVCR
jgi:hypothetical protein